MNANHRYYVIRQKSTGFLIPANTRKVGRRATALSPCDPTQFVPRLFISTGAAKNALRWWLQGEWHEAKGVDGGNPNTGPEYYCEQEILLEHPERKAEDMEIVPYALVEADKRSAFTQRMGFLKNLHDVVYMAHRVQEHSHSTDVPTSMRLVNEDDLAELSHAVIKLVGQQPNMERFKDEVLALNAELVDERIELRTRMDNYIVLADLYSDAIQNMMPLIDIFEKYAHGRIGDRITQLVVPFVNKLLAEHRTRTELYFEAHITLDPATDLTTRRINLLQEFCKAGDFRLADFTMAHADAPQPKPFLSCRDNDFRRIVQRCEHMCMNVLAPSGYKVVRAKVENTLLDTNRGPEVKEWLGLMYSPSSSVFVPPERSAGVSKRAPVRETDSPLPME